MRLNATLAVPAMGLIHVTIEQFSQNKLKNQPYDRDTTISSSQILPTVPSFPTLIPTDVFAASSVKLQVV